MTHENLELCASLLVRFCSWRWMREKKRGLCMLRPPNEGSEWEPSPKWVGGAEREHEFLEVLAEVPLVEQRFYEWWTGGAVRYPRGRHNLQFAEHGMPRLTESLDACAMLKTALLAKGMCLQILIDPPTQSMRPLTDVTIFDGDMRQLSRSIAAEFSAQAEALAICRAADAIPEGNP